MKKLGTNRIKIIGCITLALLMAGCGNSSGRGGGGSDGGDGADTVFTDPGSGDDNMGGAQELPISCDDIGADPTGILVAACCATINVGTICDNPTTTPPANCDGLMNDPSGLLLAACCATVNMGDACATAGAGICDPLPADFQAPCCAMGGTGNICTMAAAGESVQSRSANVSAMLTGAVIGGDQLAKASPQYADLALPLTDLADSIAPGTLFDALSVAVETLQADGEVSSENAAAAFIHLADSFSQFADDQTTAADVRAAANLIAAVLTALATDPANRAESLAAVSTAIAVALAGTDLDLLQELALRSLGTQF